MTPKEMAGLTLWTAHKYLCKQLHLTRKLVQYVTQWYKHRCAKLQCTAVNSNSIRRNSLWKQAFYSKHTQLRTGTATLTVKLISSKCARAHTHPGAHLLIKYIWHRTNAGQCTKAAMHVRTWELPIILHTHANLRLPCKPIYHYLWKFDAKDLRYLLYYELTGRKN